MIHICRHWQKQYGTDTLRVVATRQLEDDEAITFYNNGAPRLSVVKSAVHYIRWFDTADPSREIAAEASES